MRCLIFAAWAASTMAAPLSGVHPRDAATFGPPITDAELNDFKLFSQYAGAAYCNGNATAGSVISCSDNACPDVTNSGAKIVKSFNGIRTDTQGFVAADATKGLILLSFKGSSSLRSWLVDFNFILHPVDDLIAGGQVHAGFLAAFQEERATIMNAVSSATAASPSSRLVVTGHSLGGALATVAAAYLRAAGHPCDLWTFGSPRAGNAVFADFVTAQPGAEHRATNQDDPVPRLPPIWAGYRHTSPESWFTRDIGPGANISAADVRTCEGDANVECNGGQLGFNVTAHVNYFGPISACAPDGLPLRATELESVAADWAAKDIEIVTRASSGSASNSTT